MGERRARLHRVPGEWMEKIWEHLRIFYRDKNHDYGDRRELETGVEKREVDCGFTSEIIADDYFAKHKLVQ